MTSVMDQQPANVNLRQVGKPLIRTDAPGKAAGKTRYAGDYTMPGMLHALILRSPLASAKLTRLDVSKAKALPGVVSVLTAQDMPVGKSATDIPGQTGRKRLDTDQQILVRERVRYHGEPIVLIAAETKAIAEKARELIEFDLEPIPGVYDIFEAQKPDAPWVQGDNNIVAKNQIRKGNADKGFEEADLIVENTFSTQFIEHAFLEPEVGLAWVDENEVINIRVSTQVIEHFRTIAEAVGVPHNKVRILGALVGGGFGGKEDITVEVYLALLAKASGRPVRMVYSREDSWFGHGKRHPFTITHKTGVTKDGKITAAKIDITSDAGAYVFLSPYVLVYCMLASPGPYKIENLHVDARSVATNNMYTSAFRGFGACQAAIAYEQQMDEIAKVLGMEPQELRRVNYMKTGDTVSTGHPVESAIWTEECVDRALEGLGEPTQPESSAIKIGQGVACYQQSYGRLTWLHDTSEAWVGIEMDGTVVVRSGVTDIGAGQTSALGQIAAELLGVPLDQTVIYNSDSAVTPLAGTSTASRALYMTGNATRMAATAVRERLIGRAAKYFEVTPKQMDLADSKAFVVDEPERSIPLKDLVAICASEGIHRSELSLFCAPFTDPLDENGMGQVHPDYTYGAQAMEVAVNTDTGEVTVLKSVAAHDVGQCINLAAVEGQIEGGTVMGIGYALSEELVYEKGQLTTPSFSEYLIPTAMDIPQQHESIILESRSGLGPFGAKGIGEPALTPSAPAVANAIAAAIGVRVTDFPITPEKVLKALSELEV